MEKTLSDEQYEKLMRVFKEHENTIHWHYNSYDPHERVAAILNHYQREAAKAIADNKQQTENTLVYFRSVIMLCETIGLAGTHAEKDARLRGLIELLNSAIEKLRKEQTEGLLDNWLDFSFGGRSEYPYRAILSNYRELEAKNKALETELAHYRPKESDGINQ